MEILTLDDGDGGSDRTIATLPAIIDPAFNLLTAPDGSIVEAL